MIYKQNNNINYLNINFLLYIIFFIKFITISAELQMNSSGCDKTKSCMFKPNGCDPQLDCTLGIIFYVSDVNKLNVQLVAHSLLPVPHYQYIAIGFSKDTIMGDDFVTECVFGPTSTAFNDVEVFISYNDKKSNDRIQLDADEQSIFFENVEGSVVNGRLMCQFTQQIIPQFDIKDRNIWNLNEKYYIFGATGTSQPDEINAHDTTPGSHFYPIVTTHQINPSLVGSKIFKLPLPFVKQTLSTTLLTNKENFITNNNDSYINTIANTAISGCISNLYNIILLCFILFI